MSVAVQLVNDDDGQPASNDPPRRDWRRWTPLAMVLVLAGAIRVVAVATVGTVDLPHGDEGYYLTQAASIAEGLGHPGARRPPGYPVVLAAIQWIAGSMDLQWIRAFQVLAGLVAIAVVYDLLVDRFGRTAAALSATMIAISPDAIHFAHFLWSEALLTTILLVAVWCLWRARTEGGWRYVVLAGLATAIGGLTREMALYLMVPFALWLAHGDGWMCRRAGLYVAVVALCIVPWTIRNHAHFGSMVLISTSRWYPIADGNLALGKKPTKSMRQLRSEYNRNPDELGREAHARSVALRVIREQQPSWIFRKLAMNSYILFAPTRSQFARFTNNGWLPAEHQELAERLLLLEAWIFSLSLLLGVAGLWLVPDRDLKLLALAVIAIFLGVYVVGNAAARFRVPILPFLLLYSGPLMVGCVRTSRWRLLGLSVTLAWLLTLVAVDVLVKPTIPISYARGSAPSVHRA